MNIKRPLSTKYRLCVYVQQIYIYIYILEGNLPLCYNFREYCARVASLYVRSRAIITEYVLSLSFYKLIN